MSKASRARRDRKRKAFSVLQVRAMAQSVFAVRSMLMPVDGTVNTGSMNLAVCDAIASQLWYVIRECTPNLPMDYVEWNELCKNGSAPLNWHQRLGPYTASPTGRTKTAAVTQWVSPIPAAGSLTELIETKVSEDISGFTLPSN